MSQRGEKGAAQPRSEKVGKSEKSTLEDGVKPENLPEIAHNGWKEWDDSMQILREYMRVNFQDLESICPDPCGRANVGRVARRGRLNYRCLC